MNQLKEFLKLIGFLSIWFFCGRLCWLALSYRISYRVVSHKLTATSDFLMHLSAMPYRPNGLQSKSLVGRQVLTWDTALRCMFVSVGLL